MTDTASENKANQFYAAEVAEQEALKAAGGLASDKTLRDEFAMAALAGVGTWCPDKAITETVSKARADYAYRQADAMLEARKTPTEDET